MWIRLTNPRQCAISATSAVGVGEASSSRRFYTFLRRRELPSLAGSIGPANHDRPDVVACYMSTEAHLFSFRWGEGFRGTHRTYDRRTTEYCPRVPFAGRL